ncbi:hypothetical protein BH09PLA1_BH09PLA1_27130 [soil metagenome]
MNLAHLVESVRAADTNRGSHLHGESHWKCGAWSGLQLVACVPGSDAEIMFLFGLFHDSQRRDDGRDADHGHRAAELVRVMHGEHFDLDDARLDLLVRACAGHVDGLTHDNPTIGLCWDADRLNLWRINVTPAHKLLSTAAARNPDVIAQSRKLEGHHRTWDEIWAAVTQINRKTRR